MALYRYFKGHEKRGVWRPIKINTEFESNALQSDKYGFCTILAVELEDAEVVRRKEGTLYSGPFYVDIDSENINHAIKVANKVISKFLNIGVNKESLDIWLSGKKGLHITIPQSYFTTEENVLNLPYVYKAISNKLFGNLDIDHSVYSGGKGRMWRLPSRQRLDNGAYKVAVSIEEVSELTEEQYHSFCSVKSRPVSPPLENVGSPLLKLLFDYGTQAAREYFNKVGKGVFIDANLIGKLNGQFPPCVNDLMLGRNVRDDIGFNAVSVQAMKAAKSFVPLAQQAEFFNAVAANNKGESYGTVESRLAHIARSYRTIVSNPQYSWACNSMLSILSLPPCDKCPISFIRYLSNTDDDDNEQL